MSTQYTNPFSLTDVGLFSAPIFVDIDKDGDLDAFIGAENGDTLFFENTGDRKSAVFSEAVINPFGIQNVAVVMGGNVGEIPQFDSNPTFGDLDGDGDLDLIVGTYPYGNQLYFENIGTIKNPVFAAPSINPFGLSIVGEFSSPTLVDIDQDGDLDAFIGNYPDGNTLYFENIGSKSQPVFAAPVTNAFGLANAGGFSSPEFGDLDRDGDLDALIGTETGDILYFENVGTARNPQFAAAQTNPFGLQDVGDYSSPHLVDIDTDGDLDAFVGTIDGVTFFFENLAGPGKTPTFATYSVVELVNDVAFGQDGNNWIQGSDRNETIYAGNGRNLIQAGGGRDYIEGGSGADTIRAGVGNDVVLGQGGDDLIYGGTGDDVLYGGDGSDTIYGDNGNDRIQGGFGYDTLDGGDGIDTVDFTNWNGGAYYNLGQGQVTFYGSYTESVTNFENIETGHGNDHIIGSDADNIIVAGGGNDRLVGGQGNDRLTGGSGADRFRFESLHEGVDRITDFFWQQGDMIEIDASSFGATSRSQFSYNAHTGALSFNASPFDGIMPQVFAILENRPHDFMPHLDIALV